jgi:MFS family permease
VTAHDAAESLSYAQLLRRNRPYRHLWLSQVVSNTGDWFSSIAVLGLTLELTDSGLALSLIMLCQMLPSFLMAPVAGVVADRFDRKRVMILADLLRAVVALGFLLVETPGDIWLIFLSAALLSGFSPFFDAARNATLPGIAHGGELLAANALSSATWGLMLTIGSAAGGLVAAKFGRPAAFELNALSFLVSALFVLRVFLPAGSGTGQPVRFFSDFVEGLRYIRHDAQTRVFLPVKATWGVAGGSAVLLYAVFGGQVFHAGDTGIAILYTARGAGTLLGTLGMKLFPSPLLNHLRWGILAGLMGYGLSFVGVSFAPSLWVTALFIMLSTGGSMVMWVFSSLGLQLVVHEGFRGRVLAADSGLFTLAFALSTVSAGLLLEMVAPRTVAWAVGVLGVAVSALWFYFVRRIPLPSG